MAHEDDLQKARKLAREQLEDDNKPELTHHSWSGPLIPPALKALPPNLCVYIQHDKIPTARELARPARVQSNADALNAKTSYIQGQDDYNIWYGKYSSVGGGPDGRRERLPAAGHCNPLKDSGYTRADLDAEGVEAYICLYFAKGVCSKGMDCKYYHRVPTLQDNDRLELLRDVFGRERHATHRDDMTGVGCFSSPCTTLFIGDFMRMDESPQILEEKLLSHFALYGPVEEIRILPPSKPFAFITYRYRAAAEFAKVAMAGYRIHANDTSEILTVRWANPGANQKKRTQQDIVRQREREIEDAQRYIRERTRHLRLLEEDNESANAIEDGDGEDANPNQDPNETNNGETPDGMSLPANEEPSNSSEEKAEAKVATSIKDLGKGSAGGSFEDCGEEECEPKGGAPLAEIPLETSGIPHEDDESPAVTEPENKKARTHLCDQ